MQQMVLLYKEKNLKKIYFSPEILVFQKKEEYNAITLLKKHNIHISGERIHNGTECDSKKA
jgi:hypothetical protein